MTNFEPIFRSPITLPTTPPRANPQVVVSDLTGVPIRLLQGQIDDILKKESLKPPATVGQVTDQGEGFLARLLPTELYLFGKSRTANLPTAATLNDRFRQANRFAQATDYTAGKAVLKLSGTATQNLLSKLCGLDFYETAFPNGQVKQSRVAKISALIARWDEAETSTYFLQVDRPFGQYFWDAVWDAGQEFQIVNR